MTIEKVANPTKAQIEKIMGELNDEDKKILEAHLKGGSRARRTDEAELLKKYPHMKEGSLVFNEKMNKQQVTIVCSHPGCENERVVYTSDLFQVSMCDEHRKEAAKAKREAKAARIKDLLAKAAEVDAEKSAK